jgi:predicted ester cyclase
LTIAGSHRPHGRAALVHRLVDEVINRGRVELVHELFAPELAGSVVEGMASFRAAFPDWREEVIDVVTEGEKLAARFRCSGTLLGEFMGAPPNGRSHEVEEVAFFRIRDGLIREYWVLADNLARLQQLGIAPA